MRLRAASQIWEGLWRENSSTEVLPRPLLAPVMRMVLPVRSGMSLVGWKGIVVLVVVVVVMMMMLLMDKYGRMWRSEVEVIEMNREA